MGIPIVSGNLLPETVQLWIEKHPQATVCGTIYWSEDTEYSQVIYLKHSYLIYKSEKIPIENVKVYMREREEVPAGAVLVVSGNLEETEGARNPGGFDAKSYYACKHIYYLMKSAAIKNVSEEYSRYREGLAGIRRSLSKILKEIAGDDAAIFQAMIVGEKGELEQEIKNLYQIGGIIHILAISGLHISMLGMGIYGLLKRFGLGLKVSGLLALCLMIQYGMMTGSGVSTLRAVCMFVLNVGAQILGRVYDMPTALSLAAVLVLMESPAYLYSSSFQLSFGAVIGIGIVMPMVQELLEIKGKWTRGFFSSLVVQLVTLPIVLWTYGEISLAGIFLNLLVLPTVNVVLASGVAGCVIAGGMNIVNCMFDGSSGMSGSVFESTMGGEDVLVGANGMVTILGVKLAKISVLPGRFFLGIYERLCSFVSEFSWLTWIAGAPELWEIVLYYGILGGALFMGNVVKRRGEIMRNVIKN